MIELEHYAARIPMVRRARGILQSPLMLKLAQVPFLPLRARTVRRYLATHEVKKLQIGAGRATLEGWLNTDLLPSFHSIVLDATEPFPFEDETFDYVFSEHQIEHLTYEDGRRMLHECYRVLKPSGRIRIATPDLAVLLGLCTPDGSEIQQRYIRFLSEKYFPEELDVNACRLINHAFYSWGHKFIYDWWTLQASLKSAGFSDIVQFESGESDDSHLRGIESHGKYVGAEVNRFETIVLEAQRPL